MIANETVEAAGKAAQGEIKWNNIKTCPKINNQLILLWDGYEGPYVGYWSAYNNHYMPILMDYYTDLLEHMFDCIHNIDWSNRCPKCTYPADDAPSPTYWSPIPEFPATPRKMNKK